MNRFYTTKLDKLTVSIGAVFGCLVILYLSGPVLAQPPPEEELWQRAMEALQAGEAEEALQVLERLSRQDERRALAGKLEVYRWRGDNRAMLRVLGRLIDYHPGNLLLRLEQAIVLWNLGERQKADRLLIGLRQRLTGQAPTLALYGRYLLFKGDFVGAARTFRQALTKDPQLRAARLGLAHCHSWAGEFDKSKMILDRLIAEDDKDVDALILRAWIWSWEGDFKNALKTFEHAYDLAPDYPEVVRGLAQTYAWDGQQGQAIRHYEWLLGLQPENVEIMLSLGRLYRGRGDYGSAVAILQQAVAIAPERPDLQQELNLAQQWAYQVDDSIRTLKGKIALQQGDVQDFVALGQAYQWRGQLRESRQIYEEALQKDTDNILLLFGLGQVLEEMNQLEKAKHIYERILTIRKDYYDAQFALERLETIYRPRANIRYSYNRIELFDQALRETASRFQGHGWTFEYAQRFHSRYELKTGYTIELLKSDDRIFSVTDYQLTHQIFYLQSEFALPFDMNLTTRYDLHNFHDRNQADNFFNLSGAHFHHGGYFLLSKPLGFNYLSFEFSRQLFEAILADLNIESLYSLKLSDDITFNKWWSAFVSLENNHSSLADGWSRRTVIHPRFNVPFLPSLFTEYEWNLADRPIRQEHQAILRWLGYLGAIQFELGYHAVYFPDRNAWGHLGQGVFVWQPRDSLSVVLTAEAQYVQHDLTQQYVTSLEWRF